MKTLTFVFQFARKYSLSLSLAIISMLSLVGVQLVIPWLIKLLISSVSGTTLSPDTMNYIGNLALIAWACMLSGLDSSSCVPTWRILPAGVLWRIYASTCLTISNA